MDRLYGGSGAVRNYAAILVVDGAVLGWDGIALWSDGSPLIAFLYVVLALGCIATGGGLYMRWGRARYRLSPEGIEVERHGESKAVRWADIAGISEFKGPPIALQDRALFYGPLLPLGLLAGERILEIIHRPGARFLIRESLVEGYGGLRQDILNYVGRDTLVNLHARYWRRQ
jgi:hypothetical protein